jgi:hypothetical protein
MGRSVPSLRSSRIYRSIDDRFDKLWMSDLCCSSYLRGFHSQCGSRAATGWKIAGGWKIGNYLDGCQAEHFVVPWRAGQPYRQDGEDNGRRYRPAPAECDVVDEVLRLTQGVGADVALECLGRDETIGTCVNVTIRRAFPFPWTDSAPVLPTSGFSPPPAPAAKSGYGAS